MEKIAYIVPSETMIPAVEEILADDVKRASLWCRRWMFIVPLQNTAGWQ